MPLRNFEKIGQKGGQKVADLIERAKSLEEERPEEPDLRAERRESEERAS